MKSKSNPANYRALSEPLDQDTANQALNAFFEAVEEARNKYHIMDAYIIVKMNIKRGDSEGEAMSSAHFGNSLNAPLMCAWGLGQEQSSFETLLREQVKK